MYDIEELKKAEAALLKRLDDMTASIREELETIRHSIAIFENLNREQTGDNEVELSGFSRIDAIKRVMRGQPNKWWRGADMARELQRSNVGVGDKNFFSKISTDLKTYSKGNERRPAYFVIRTRDNSPEYRLVGKSD